MGKSRHICFVSIFIASCGGVDKGLENNVTKDSLRVVSKEIPIQPVIDTIYKSPVLRLLADTTIEEEKLLVASVKFEPFISFQDFKVESIDKKSKAKLDLKSNKEAKYYRTRIREYYNVDTPNFAGHYTLVKWGCGSPCQASVIVDRQTGKIYDSPTAQNGYEFRADSKMLIVNPPDSIGFYDDCIWCKPQIYIFDEQSKKFIERYSEYK